MKRPIIFLFLLGWICLPVFAQENSFLENLEIGVDYKQGMVVKHDKYMGHLSKGITRGFEIDILRRTTGKTEWQRLANYPDVGLSIVFFNYPTDILGESWGINYVTDYYLIRKKRFQSTFRLGLGLGFHTNPYHKETNNKNITYGSPVTFSIQSKLNLKYNIYKNISLHGGLAFQHFSMADIKRPNKGLNVFTTDVGLTMLLNKNDQFIQATEEEKNYSRKVRYNILFNAFFASYRSADQKKYPVYSLSLFAQKPVGRLFDLTMGIDFFNNYVLKDVMKDDSSLDPALPLPDHKKIGFAMGTEYHMNKMAIAFSIGYYVYKPYDFYSDLYQRYALKYYFSDKVFINGGFKTHGADAENAELGIGYRF